VLKKKTPHLKTTYDNRGALFLAHAGGCIALPEGPTTSPPHGSKSCQGHACRSHAEAAGEVDAHFARMPAPEASPKPSPGAEEATGAGEAPFADVASNSAARTNSSSKVSMPTSTLLESSAFGIADGDGPSEEIAFDTARHGATPAKQSEQESNLQTILYFIYSGHTASFSGT
jgi:hypothetical protein